MKTILPLFAMIGLNFAASSVASAAWCHESDFSQSGAEVRIDNEVSSSLSRFDGTITFRSNVWLNLIDETLSGDEAVRFVLLSFNSTGNLTDTQEYDATYYEDVKQFSAKGPLGLQISGQFSGERFNEVAVVVDGEWLKASNGSSNFLFNANRYEGKCANPY